jgi:hypothetical protein
VARCSKIRVFVPLATPWTSDRYENGHAAADAWEKLYLAVGRHYGLQFDEACKDVARLFYLPRHNGKGPLPEKAILDGRCLTLEELEAAAAAGFNENRHEHRHRTRASGPRWVNDIHGQIIDPTDWARGYAARFEIATALQAQAPGLVRKFKDGTATIQCAFEDEHTTPGGEGTIAVNASAIGKGKWSQRKKGFAVVCQHNGCKSCNRDRLDYLERMLELGWLTVEDLTSPEFLTEAARGEEDSWEAKLATEIEKLNERYFVASLGGSGVIAKLMRDEQLDRERLVFSKPNDFRLIHGNNYLQVGTSKKGEPVCESIANIWLKDPRRRTYTGGIALVPRGEVPEDVYNLWRGWGVDLKPGEWSTIAEFLGSVICSGNQAHFDWLIKWMAHCVQCPEKQAGVAIVLKGLKGIGKGSFAKVLQRFFASHHVHISNGRHLTGHFNSHLADCLFLFVDEAFWAGDKQAEGVLKAVISEPALQIEPKGVDAFMVPNRLKIVIASNNEWVVPATADERRFFMLDVSPHRKADKPYWAKVNAAIEGDEIGALLDYLLNLDISVFDHRNPPHTEALGQQKLRGADSVQKFWHDCLREGAIIGTSGDEWPVQVPTRYLHDAYVDHAKKHGERYTLTASEMVKHLDRLWTGCAVRNKQPSGKTTGTRQRVWVLDRLVKHRAAFLKAMAIDPDHYAWPAEVSDAAEDIGAQSTAEEGTGAEHDGVPFPPSVSAGLHRGNREHTHPRHEPTEKTGGAMRGGGGDAERHLAENSLTSCSPCSPCASSMDPRASARMNGCAPSVPPVSPSSVSINIPALVAAVRAMRDNPPLFASDGMPNDYIDDLLN